MLAVRCGEFENIDQYIFHFQKTYISQTMSTEHAANMYELFTEDGEWQETEDKYETEG